MDPAGGGLAEKVKLALVEFVKLLGPELMEANGVVKSIVQE